MGNIYLVEAIDQNYEITHKVILVTEDREKAEVLARNEADDTEYGTRLSVWNNDELVEEVKYHNRLDMNLILTEIPQDMHYWSKATSKVVQDLKESTDIKELIIIGNASDDLKLLIRDYIPELPCRIMNEEQYAEFLNEGTMHVVLCDIWDDHLLPEIK